MRTRLRDDDGFTLAELLVVIVILAALATVVTMSTKGAGDGAISEACAADVQSVIAASESYYAETGGFAPDLQTLVTQGFLLSAPQNDGYTVAYSPMDGSASASHGTPPVAGCP